MGDFQADHSRKEITGPKHGVTVRAHVVDSLERAEADFLDTSYRIQGSPKLTKAQRVAYSRKLAGVISDCESVRVWLEAGCPEGEKS